MSQTLVNNSKKVGNTEFVILRLFHGEATKDELIWSPPAVSMPKIASKRVEIESRGVEIRR